MIINFLKRQAEKRKYIRHPARVSIEYHISGEPSQYIDYTKDISLGGLRFQAQANLKPGTILTLRFPTINPGLKVSGKVVWCASHKEYYEVGLQFLDENEAYRARVLEEICHIINLQQEERIKSDNRAD